MPNIGLAKAAHHCLVNRIQTKAISRYAKFTQSE